MATTNVKFLSAGYITGSDEVVTSTGTITTGNLLDRNDETTWSSVAEGGDGTSATITWTPPASKTIDTIFLKNHNLGSYHITYDGTDTDFSPAINYASVTGTNSYHEVGTQAVASVVITMTNTIVADEEKYVGEIYIGLKDFEADKNPAEYNPIISKKGFDLDMADGGVKSIWYAEKFKADLNFNFVSTTEIANFNDLYNDHASFYFAPTPTDEGTDWDGDSWLVNWVGDKDMYKLTNGISKVVGFDVNMSLWEVSN